jgi:hypothetical protein
MSIHSRQDWIDTARAIVPRLPNYMASISGQVDPDMVEAELSRLLTAEDWEGLRKRFHEIWWWLPDRADIRRHPFGSLCDLCSEDWALNEAPSHRASNKG